MRSSATYAESINRLYTQQKKVKPTPEWPDGEKPLDHLMMSVLSDGGNVAKARAALSKMVASTVDLNDLRVSTPQFLANLIASSMPNGLPRTTALVRVLNSIFEHENEVSLDRLKTITKKERREYLKALDGISPYVVSCTMIFGFGDHAIAVEHGLLETFKKEGLIAEDCTADQAQHFLERHIPASEGPLFTLVMKRYAATKSPRLSTSAASKKKSTTKKKKSVAKKA